MPDNPTTGCIGMYSYDEITTVHLEVTQRCQAACPMCDRNENGGVDNKHINNSELSLEDCQRIFKPEFIRQLKTMYMCGNLGDPIMARDTLEIFQYFRQHNPTMWLSMNTNAGAKSPDWWRELALTFGRMGTVIFSIDGLEDTNHMYRQNVNWGNVHRNATAFIAAGGRARWDYLIFQHNEHQVEVAEALSKSMGFERFQKKKSGRFITVNSASKDAHQAQNRKGENTAVIAKPAQESNQNIALSKQAEIEKTYGSMREYYDSCTIRCKVAEEKNIFITAEGLLMPCCWTAGRMYKWWHKDYRVEQIWDHIDAAGGKDAIDTRTHGLEAVMQGKLLKSIESSWNKSSIESGKLGVCAMKCGSEFDPFGAQFV
jgi:MoaA/NifB/PqqE/SkfB family radical SAM enzyme